MAEEKWMDASVITGMLTELLYRAVEHGTAAQVAWLLQMGADPEGGFVENAFSPLYRTGAHRESDFERIEIAQLLLDAGADINRLTATRSNVAIAARSGRTELVRFLLEHGADPALSLDDMRDGAESPLTNYALAAGQSEIADMIREVLGQGR